MIRTIIFDIGNVLVHFRGREMFAESGIGEEDLRTIVNATLLHPLWNELDRGVFPTEDILRSLIAEAPQFEKEITRIVMDAEDMVVQYEYALPWIRSLRAAGYQVYALSNWSKPLYDACIHSHLSFLSEMDGAVISYREHLLKPDPAIYRLICERYGFAPEEAVFLDDNADNIASAKDFGLHTIHFIDYLQAKKELSERFGIE